MSEFNSLRHHREHSANIETMQRMTQIERYRSKTANPRFSPMNHAFERLNGASMRK